jgi:ribosome-associated toxin RatA of RatAB toxin-antitoxin module
MMSQPRELPLSSSIWTSAWQHTHILLPRNKSEFVAINMNLDLKWNLWLKFNILTNIWDITINSTHSQILKNRGLFHNLANTWAYGLFHTLSSTWALWFVPHSCKYLSIMVCSTILQILEHMVCSTLLQVLQHYGSTILQILEHYGLFHTLANTWTLWFVPHSCKYLSIILLCTFKM